MGLLYFLVIDLTEYQRNVSRKWNKLICYNVSIGHIYL